MSRDVVDTKVGRVPRTRLSPRFAAVVALSTLLNAQGGASRVTLTDITAAAGITARHDNGAAGNKLLPETMGAGCAFLDYDADGWQDILIVNGMDWPGRPSRVTRRQG